MALSPTISFIQGDDTGITITVTDDTGAPIDITSYRVYFTVKSTLKSTNDNFAVITVDTTNHTNPTAGITLIDLPHEKTNVTSGTYYYDFRLIDPSGDIASIQYGQCTIYPAVTQRVS